jgi:hypothetical protein
LALPSPDQLDLQHIAIRALDLDQPRLLEASQGIDTGIFANTPFTKHLFWQRHPAAMTEIAAMTDQ